MGYPRDTGLWKRLRLYRGGGYGLAALIQGLLCQSQDSTKKMDDPSSPVSPDSAGPQLLSISASFAAPLQLFPPPFRSVSRSGRCSASACAPQDECRGGKRGGRWGRGGDNRLPGGSTQQKEFHINAPLYWATARRHLSWKQKRCFIDPHRDR